MGNCKEIESEKSINDILKSIVDIERTNENFERDIEEISLALIAYYDKVGRHSYSEISTFLYSTKDENLEYIYENLSEIERYVTNSNLTNSSRYVNQLRKLEDHIKLEVARLYNFREVENLTKRIHDETIEYEEKIKGVEKAFDKQKKNIDGINNQIITIVGIFSAIVITFFGGINFIESVMASIGTISKYRLVFTVLLVGFVMFNTIFMLFNFISKLIEKNIRSDCKYYTDSSCTHNCTKRGKISCIKEKHPTIFWVNLILLIGMILITIVYYCDTYNAVDMIIGIVNNKFAIDNQ